MNKVNKIKELAKKLSLTNSELLELATFFKESVAGPAQERPTTRLSFGEYVKENRNGLELGPLVPEHIANGRQFALSGAQQAVLESRHGKLASSDVTAYEVQFSIQGELLSFCLECNTTRYYRGARTTALRVPDALLFFHEVKQYKDQLNKQKEKEKKPAKTAKRKSWDQEVDDLLNSVLS